MFLATKTKQINYKNIKKMASFHNSLLKEFFDKRTLKIFKHLINAPGKVNKSNHRQYNFLDPKSCIISLSSIENANNTDKYNKTLYCSSKMVAASLILLCRESKSIFKSSRVKDFWFSNTSPHVTVPYIESHFSQ